MIKKIFIYSFLLVIVLFGFGCNEEDTPVVTPDDNELQNPDNDGTHTHNYVDGVCECGDVDPNYEPEVTDKLGIDYSTLELNIGEAHTFTILDNKNITITSSDPAKVLADSALKTIVALDTGTVIVTVTLTSDPTQTKELVVTVKSNEPEEIVPLEIVIENAVDKLYLDDEYQLKVKVLPEGASQSLIFQCANKTRASIDKEGNIKPLLNGSATFRIFSAVDQTINATLTIEIQPTINPDKFIESLAITNPIYERIKVTIFQDPGYYYHQLTGGITNYLFEDLEIIEKLIPAGNGNRPGRIKNGIVFEAKYVTFHDTASGSTGSKGHASYWSGSNVDTSCHFTTGNEGVYQLLPYDEIAYHAGDGTSTKLLFMNTNVKAPEGSTDPAKVTISSDGYFEMNGVKSTIKAPNKSDGTTPTNANLPYTGINNYVNEKTGTYYISDTYWNSTYKTVSNRGGNLNSIGIESCIEQGSNIYYTWAMSAKLIGQAILPTCGLGIGDIKQHNTFSGKNCPQTMREANRWETFIELCTAEHMKAKYFSDWTITLNCNSEYVGSNGLIKSLPTKATEISYSITFSNGKDYNKTFDFKTTLPAAA